MAESCLLGLQGKDNIYECAYVQSTVVPGLDFFASKVCYTASTFFCSLPDAAPSKGRPAI